MKSLKIFQFWLFLCVCTYLSLTPAPPDMLKNYWDKLLHGGGYFALFLSIALAYPEIGLVRMILSLLSYSVLIEVVQHFIPNRGFSLLDILANFSGLVFGCLLYASVSRLQTKWKVS